MGSTRLSTPEQAFPVIDVMRAEGVELPDPSPVAAMKFEGDSRGGPFDARSLSRIL